MAAMERTMENDKAGIIDPNDNLGLQTFPMTTADQAALGDPLEDFWIQGTTPLSATATGSPTNGNAPLTVNFTGSASGGTSPYKYSWNFGDGSAASTSQNPSHTYTTAGTYTATLTVTDTASPVHTATSTVPVTVNAVGNPLAASASGTPTSGQTPLVVNFTGTGTGGTPPYSYSWNFGDGTPVVTSQNPSHTYQNAGTFTATLTVTDSASPANTATSTVSVTASPIAGTAPGAPTGLTATPGSGQVALSWTPPSNNGGVNITSYKVYRGTSSGGETLLTSGGCSGLGAVTSCTDTGLTNGTTYYYTVSAMNAIGEGPVSNEANATPAGGTCTAAQVLVDPGFESGTSQTAWTASSGVINNSTSEPPHAGTWDAWLDGYGAVHTDTLSQSATIPAGCTSDSLSFWLHVDTANTSGAAQDTLNVQLLNSSGTVLTTLATYSNLNANTGYAQKTFDVSAYAGQAITLKLTGTESGNGQTSFVVDDFALNVAGGGGGGNTVTVTNPGSQTGQVGTAASLQMAATDSASGQTLTYSATGLPAGLSINSSSGLISGTPTTAGTSSVTVTVTDGTGASGTASFSWTINAVQNVVTVTNPGAQTGTVGTAASLQIHATDSASKQTLTYSATGLPAGLSINSSSGLISGTPTAAASSNVTVKATDGTGASGTTSFTWTIASSGGGGCTAAQLLGNPGFETGSASPWTASSGVINSDPTEPPHSGSWDAWLDGYGVPHTDTLAQTVTIPSGCVNATFTFYLHIDTGNTSGSAQDTLKAQVLSSTGSVLKTLATYSNLNANSGYALKTFSIPQYIGQKVTLKFTGTETGNGPTSFVIDDTALKVS
jgi:PKD repeat protein